MDQLLNESQRLAGLGSWEWDALSNRVLWSDELYRVFGVAPQSFPATLEGYLERVHPDDRARVHGAIMKAVTEGSSFNHQERIYRSDGIIRILQSRGRAIVGEGGRTVRLVGTCQDITERLENELERERLLEREKRARQQCETSSRMLHNILERVSDGFVALDTEWRYTHVNEKAGEMLGRRPDLLIGKHIWSEFPEGVGQKLFLAYHRAMHEQVPIFMEEYYPPWDRWFENRIYPSEDGLSIFFSDVTTRRKAQEALRQSQERFREIAETVGEVFWIRSNDFKTLDYVSPAFERIFGIPAEPLHRATEAWMSVIHPEDREGMREILARGTEGRLEGTYRIIRPDGALRWIFWKGFPVKSRDGTVLRIIGFSEDVTEFKEIELALRDSETRLARALHVSEDRVVQLEEQVRARSSFQRLVGKSAPMQEVYRKLRLAAQSDVTVLLTGESGTGKELAASAIHSLSDRRNKPFVAVNCAAIPEALLESELFGHAKGAFTGAVRDKTGLFQAADGGTLFLDEAAEMPPQLQVKVLRALQEREFRRLGDERVAKIDVRIIAATNRDLPRLLSSGKLREDFYYRIRVFEIVLPALRNRGDDIPLLVHHFLSTRTQRGPVDLAPEAVRALMEYSWPGNVRELQNAIEHALVTATGTTISLSDLPPDVREQAPAALLSQAESADRERIQAVLEDTGWNRTKAAALLGISRVTLWKKMRRLGLSPDRMLESVNGAGEQRSP
jgi:PAS domain S-box-containing protein